jgi:GPH family glycoside/pentoside/hexuronide:cation symporter
MCDGTQRRVTHPASASSDIPFLRKIGYAVGDYGCNLYWQSLSFFLLFFYTEVIGIPVAAAGLIYMIASIFDGCIDPLVGAALDRHATRWGRYRPWLIIGAVPLAIAFAALYWRPPLSGTALLLGLAVVHMVFRACYTLVAVPLASLSANMTSSSRDRTTLASLRTLFGAAATATIGFFTQPLARLIGGADQPRGLFGAAVVIGAVATVALIIAGVSSTEKRTTAVRTAPRAAMPGALAAIFGNRAFLILAAGLLFATLSTTAISKCLLYYFKFVVHDAGGARIALSSAALISLALAPVWALLGLRVGKRRMWMAAAAMGLAGLSVFAVVRPTSVAGATAFFMWMQVATVGIQVGYWGTLPDTVEYGQLRSGVRRESVLFGLFMFTQKLGLGLSAAVLGWALAQIGFESGAGIAHGASDRIGLLMAGLSATGLIGSGVAAWLSPLRLGVHERIVADLAAAEVAAQRDDGVASAGSG